MEVDEASIKVLCDWFEINPRPRAWEGVQDNDIRGLVNAALTIGTIPIYENLELTTDTSGWVDLDEDPVPGSDDVAIPQTLGYYHNMTTPMTWQQVHRFLTFFYETRPLKSHVFRLEFDADTEEDTEEDADTDSEMGAEADTGADAE
jgi:hypothetical protein